MGPQPKSHANSEALDSASLTPIQGAPRRRFNHVLRGYLATDMLALLAGFLCSWSMAALINSLYYGREMASPFYGMTSMRAIGLLSVAAITLVWFQHKGHYRVRMNFWLELKNVITALTIAMLVDGFLQFAAKNEFSRLWLMSGWMFACVGILAMRGLYRALLRRSGHWRVATMLVGNGQTAADTSAALQSETGLGYDITARIANLPEAFLMAGRSWERLCAEHEVDYVVIALDGTEFDQATQPIAQLTRDSVPFSISPPRRHLPVLDMVPQYFFSHDVKLLTYSSGLEQPLPRLVKRLFDITVSGTLLLLISPLMLALAVLTKRDGGPVFFGHARIGKKGAVFQCLKFRSMVHNAQAILAQHLAENPTARAEWEADHKLKNDPRITGFGAFLRRSSLDELPQLFNVLKGEMSLVGPRPIVAGEVAKYAHDIAHYYRVSPGITGLWQVSGRNDVTYDQRVQMDSWYVRNWSLWHDVAIMCKTVPALLKRRGAY
ncbi:MAG: undecaprenyl-phosphate galactose phosphotransferase WbaP [Pseudomonadota bacterium]